MYSAISPDSPKSGYLLYINERTLMAQQFNAGRLETAQDPVVLAERYRGRAQPGAGADFGFHHRRAGLSERGTIHPPDGVDGPRPAGRLRRPANPGAWGPPRISPDGRRAVVAKTGADGMTAHFGCSIPTAARSRFRMGRCTKGRPYGPRMARALRISASRATPTTSSRARRWRAAKGELLLKTSDKKFPSDWSRDGKNIIFSMEGVGTRLDIWGLSLADRHAAPVVNTVYAEGFATLSPDGRWMAYQSDQSGRNEVYVQAFDGLQERHEAALDGVQGRRSASLARRSAASCST